MARYEITHRTCYDYRLPVSLSQQLLHVQPRPLPWQTLEAASLHIDPPGARQLDRLDAFGNPCLALSFSQPHQRLDITATLDVSVRSRPRQDPALSPPWESVVAHCRYQARPLPDDWLEAMRYRQESPFVHIQHDFADWARPSFPPGRPLAEAVLALMQRLHDTFTFDAEATQVGTPLQDVLRQRRGVCQDFAHLMIAALRALGLPARYVSGYLLTQPPPGQPRLIGADASHAWVAFWCPVLGWLEVDPTNAVIPDDQHITVAWGRDFSDVSPLRGVIVGGGEHTVTAEVTVLPIGD